MNKKLTKAQKEILKKKGLKSLLASFKIEGKLFKKPNNFNIKPVN